MKVTIRDRRSTLQDRLRERLARVAELRCEEHGEAIEAVTINSCENGWFDATWISCCEQLNQQADGVVKERC